MFRLSALHPFLFVAVGLLYLAAEHPGGYLPRDLLVVLGIALAFTGLAYLLAVLVLRRRGEGLLAPLFTLLIVLWFVGLPHLMGGFRGGHRNPLNIAVALAGLGLTGLAAYWISRRPTRLRNASALFTLTGGILVVRFAVDVVADQMRSRRAVAASAVVRDLARPIDAAATSPVPKRDVYLLVLDEYANAAVLRERFGFDNRAFTDSLRALGFHVPAEVRSNYFHTILSLPSLLSAAHLVQVADELPHGATDPAIVNRVLDQSRIAAYLKAQGYRYIFFPSLWWVSTQTAPQADSVVRVWSGFRLGRELTRTEFRRAVQKSTALRYVMQVDPHDADHVRRTLEAFGRLPSVEGPVFAFAHVLSPHSPYVFDRRCGPISPPVAARREEAYIGQLQCVNSMVLDLVTRLLRDSEVPPVILIQGDHGTAMLRYSDAPSAALVPPEAARERFGAFGAYFLPDSGEVAFGDTVTVVNVLGNVLRHYFDAGLSREPDDRYASLEDTPYELLRRTDPAPPAVLDGTPGSHRPRRASF